MAAGKVYKQRGLQRRLRTFEDRNVREFETNVDESLRKVEKDYQDLVAALDERVKALEP